MFNDALYHRMNLIGIESREEMRRKQLAEDIYSYLINDYDAIKQILRRRMKENNKVGLPDEWELTCINILRKIVRNIATLYIERPVIKVMSASGAIDEKSTDTYDFLADKFDWWTMRQKLNQYLVAFNVVHSQIVVRDGKIDVDIIPPHLITVKTKANDYLTPEVIRVAYDGEIIGLNDQIVYKTFTEDSTYWSNAQGKYIEGINDMGWKDQIIITRLENKDEYWGDGMTDTSAINTEINLLHTSLMTHALYQGGPILFGLNLTENAVISLGPNKMVSATSKGVTETPPTLQYVSPPSNAQNIIASIDYMIKTAYNTKGLSASSYTLELTGQSGVSKQLDNAELTEMRLAQISTLTSFEQDFFDKVKVYYNEMVKTQVIPNYGLLSGDDVLVDYAEPEPYIDDATKFNTLKTKIDLGIASPLDYIKDENKDMNLTDEEAEKVLARNLELKKMLNSKYGNLFGGILGE